MNDTIFVARQHVWLIGAFTTLELAQAACQEHYNRYTELVNYLKPDMLNWSTLNDPLQSCIASPAPAHVKSQAIYYINEVTLNVNLRVNHATS